MQMPLEITFHQMEPSPAIEARIREKAAQLERFSDRITSCRVTVEREHGHHRQGNLYRVRLDVRLPGRREIAVTHTGPRDHAHEDVQVALRDAFDAAVRRLEDHVRGLRGQVKAHAAPLHGRVARLFPEAGYGFIETADGEEVYFHRHSVVAEGGGFDRLEVGSEVRLSVAERESEAGWQATTVHPVGKHHVVG